MKTITFLKISESDYNEGISMPLYSEITDRRKKYLKSKFNGKRAFEMQFEGDISQIEDIVMMMVDEKVEFEVTVVNGKDISSMSRLFIDGEYIETKSPVVGNPLKFVSWLHLKKLTEELEASNKTILDYEKFEERVKSLL